MRRFVAPSAARQSVEICFIALMGASSFELAGTFIVSLIILMFYARKMHERQSHSMDNHTASKCAFKKVPDYTNAKDGSTVEWTFDSIKVDMKLGTYE